MLQVKNLTKIYRVKGKKSVETRALDCVNLDFPKTGMVFLLGKSGSGKSTLLNLCGGLDSPTDGEIIVKGRSSKSFSQSDFDSYRNTYVGFIFQEYNVLNEFSVEDNVALALELQGKPKDEGRILEILKEVEMEELAGRKPNTLSGGQKQRVAIARALVKNPEIIMADEPTGALDSETGEQVFSTLKKLSESKLVLVVSHDRDFAERYGDRIIELKDGKVLSDLSKNADGNFVQNEMQSAVQEGEPPKFIRSRLPLKRAARIGVSGLKTKPVRLAFTLLLCMLSFALFGLFSTLMLYDKEATVRKSLQDSDSKYVVLHRQYDWIKRYYSLNSDSWRESREAVHYKINETEVESYKATYGEGVFGVIAGGGVRNLGGDPQTVAPLEEASISGWAVLPKDTSSIKLIAGNFPVTEEEILVSEYFARGVMVRGFSDGQATPKTDAEVVGKRVQLEFGSYTVSGVFESDYEGLVKKYPALVSGANCTDEEYNSQRTWVSEGYRETLSTVAFCGQSLFDKIVEDATKYSSVSDSLLNFMKSDGLRVVFAPEKMNGFAYYVNADYLPKQATVVGSSELKQGEMLVTSKLLADICYDSDTTEQDALIEEVHEAFFRRVDKFLQEVGYLDKYDKTTIPDFQTDPEMAQIYWDYLDYLRLIEENGGTLDEQWFRWDESFDADFPLYRDIFLPLWTEGGENSYQARYEKVCLLKDRLVEVDGIEKSFICWALDLEDGILTDRNQGYEVIAEHGKIDDAMEIKIVEALLEEMQTCTFLGKIAYENRGGNTWLATAGEERSYRVAGVILSRRELVFIEETTYEAMKADSLAARPKGTGFSLEWSETKYMETEKGIYDYVYLPYNHSKAQTDGLKIFGFNYVDGGRVVPYNAVVRHVESASKMVNTLSKIFLWVGVGMAVFSALLLSNFISVSIAGKKKDIGILRAVGARGADVFKIFYAESLMIAAICVGLGVLASIIGCGVLNVELGSALSGVSLFVFGPVSIGIMLGVAMITATVATLLPVYLAAKKKPVESIRAL